MDSKVCVDFHVHSNMSDGTLSPTEVVKLAKEAGLTAIALTDHDTIDGVSEAIEAGKKYGVKVVPGIEISAEYKGGDLHILGLNVDYLNEEFGINQIITNDLTYGASAEIDQYGRPAITTQRYFPKNKITFIATNPGGKLGVGLWGDPPELDVANMLKVNGSSVSPYVYITQWTEKDPAVLWTKASALFMPVLYNPNSLFIAEVEETSA